MRSDAKAVANEVATTFSAERIRKTLRNVAILVDAYGEAYLPLFEMLEQEVAKAELREERMDRARRLASEARAV